MSDLTVPQIILEQLGGRRFAVMTGAHTFIGSDTHLSFSLPRSHKSINVVRITLMPSDTYLMEFIRATKRTETPVMVDVREDVYCDQLQEIFTSVTGLYTRL